MKPEILKALKAGIAKYRSAERGQKIGIFSDSCQLCKITVCCEGCPVFETGKGYGCKGTPWEDIYNWWDSEDFCSWSTEQKIPVRLARAERKFLESLLPKTQKKEKLPHANNKRTSR